jgi:NADPH:quinone reductase-like Zn-dependent oxidoreductase
MRALHAYAANDPSQVVYEDAPMPILGPGDVLLRVHASGVTPTELTWPSTWVNPDGSTRPLPIIPGHEVSGTVVAVADGVDDLKIGDEVYGLTDFQRDGADAEFIAARASELAPKPRSVTHIETAATPLSALSAWEALFEHGELRAGQHVLIHGAAGGVGSFAVQFARWRGAYVIGTASTANVSAVRALGADEVIDYRATRFDEAVRDIDVVVDTVGGETWERSWSVLRPNGVLVSIAVPRPSPESRRPDVRAVWFVVATSRERLTEIARVIDTGQVRPLVSGTLPLAQGRDAFDTGLHRRGAGKIVLTIGDDEPSSSRSFGR